MRLDEIDRRGFLKGAGAAAVGAAVGSAHAKGDWILYHTGTGRSLKKYLDKNSIKKMGDHIYDVWTKIPDFDMNTNWRINVKEKLAKSNAYVQDERPSGWFDRPVMPDGDVDALIDKLIELGYK